MNQLSEKEKNIVESLFKNSTEDINLIYEDFYNRNRDANLSKKLMIDYVATDICDTIHDNILVGMYKKEDIPNLSFLTYKEMFDLISKRFFQNVR